MKKDTLYKRALIATLLFLCLQDANAQYKDFKLSSTGDTLNIIDKKGLKQGKWVISVPEIRGEPGYDEEGIYKDDKKEGTWRMYTTDGDIIGVENYRFGGKDGSQQYYTYLGQIEREEEWHSYDPNSPYDTIPVYGVGSNDVLSYKIVKAVQYSVPNGVWKYYDGSGGVEKTEKYDHGLLVKDDADKIVVPVTASTTVDSTSKKDNKPQEVLDYEKKYSKKKRQAMERTGETGL